MKKIINSLKTKESSGYDEISIKILKTSAPFISSPLNYICNKYILSVTFPTRLKYAVVKPLLKKGDTQNVANYRPISLLTSFSPADFPYKYHRSLALLSYLTLQPMKMDLIEGFETSAIINQTPGNYPKESLLYVF